MSNRLSDAMKQLNVEGSRNSLTRPPASPNAKRNSGLDTSTIHQMFPDAAAAIASQRARYAHQTSGAPGSNRNSAAYDNRPTSLVAPSISTTADVKDSNQNMTSSGWGNRDPQPIARPKSSAGGQGPHSQQPQQPQIGNTAGQHGQPLGSASFRPQVPEEPAIRTTTLNTSMMPELPAMSPYATSGNWASMVNTPMVPSFNHQQAANSQADMMANATAMKLAALSTVSNRIALDDAKKYRRARETNSPLPGGVQIPLSPGMGNFALNENNAAVFAAMQAQQNAVGGRRSPRPNSPGIAIQGGTWNNPGFMSPQQNGFLAAYDGSGILNGSAGLVNFGHGGPASSHDGYLSDHSDMHPGRGRSPRGRRGTSKPPEDPTDPLLLQDIPAWLRSLRLHKYTDNLKDLKWTDLVELDDEALEKRGVNALGARRKMLKVCR
jgi:hypothetical protein